MNVVCKICDSVFENIPLDEYFKNFPYVCPDCAKKNKLKREIEHK